VAKKRKFDLYMIIYGHRYGVDALPVLIPAGGTPPEITNEVLKNAGIDNPELEDMEDEWASWSGPIEMKGLPVIGGKGVFDWYPE
jgi:hypothetical protein